jgi:hypothetical protein
MLPASTASLKPHDEYSKARHNAYILNDVTHTIFEGNRHFNDIGD